MTCCMQWKIAVDDDTYRKWKDIDREHRKLSSYTSKIDGGRVIKLNDRKQCPFLAENGLCSLVMEHGDGILSHTCDTFPRQVHEFADRTESSVVSCCPEVIDSMNRDKIRFSKDLPVDSEDFLVNVRNLMIYIVSQEDYQLEKALLMAYRVLLDIFDKESCDCMQYTNKELLDELYQGICQVPIKMQDAFVENNELWLDIVENYRKEGLYGEYIEPVSKFAEELGEKSIEDIVNDWQNFRKDFAGYESLFRNYAVNEFFSNMLIPDSDIESLVVMMQWILMEYVVIRQGIFLKSVSGGKMISYETVRDYIVVISRMTGYDLDDIYEYMENCFCDVIWEWFYGVLILG